MALPPGSCKSWAVTSRAGCRGKTSEDLGVAGQGASGALLSIAPELIAGSAATPASDLLALGVLLRRLSAQHRKTAREFYAEFYRLRAGAALEAA